MHHNDNIKGAELAIAIAIVTANPGKPTPQKIVTEKYLH